MASPTGSTTTMLRRTAPSQEMLFAETEYYRCEVRLICTRQKTIFTSLRFGAVLSTGDFYSVVLPYFGKKDVAIFCERVSVPFTPTWFGIRCEVVKVGLGLPVLESPHPRHFKLLALLPLDPSAIPDDVPPLLRLGTEFLHRNRVEVMLPSENENGRLVIPV